MKSSIPDSNTNELQSSPNDTPVKAGCACANDAKGESHECHGNGSGRDREGGHKCCGEGGNHGHNHGQRDGGECCGGGHGRKHGGKCCH